ncbi:Periplasmic pH-dependent serine endoprotease DegQ [Candidatus Vallotia lariciata]|nr:trypsin-like peptidase domain-containing protein [Candidatus Vallotia lariciata]UDG82770.1 Periplasmic pH-dependent serine endoprotease DegQ [Candidatus Vallotia lariciata]
MLRRFCLFFAQAVTILLALMFVFKTLRPYWVRSEKDIVGHKLSPLIPVPKEVTLEGRRQLVTSYADAAQHAMPAVVNVFSIKDNSHLLELRPNDRLFRYLFNEHNYESKRERQEPADNLGSGVIVSSDGYILTNQHVVDGADEIKVALADGRMANAKIIGVDPETDIAVLKITLSNLPIITLGRIENARVGDVVLAIGNPFGVGQTVTMGIISALGRNHLGINTFENFIQTDAPINPGNSGGALVDVNGNLLGINTAIYSRSGGSLGIGFAIPISTARNVLDSIIRTGTVMRGWIGVELQEVNPEITKLLSLPQKSGVLVSGMLRGGPADKAGIKPGDILMKVNGENITDTASLLNAIALIKPGTVARMHLWHKSREINVNVTIGKRLSPPK